jgi:hypothetical protein
MNNVKYVGMDVHKAITVIVVLNAFDQAARRRSSVSPEATSSANSTYVVYGREGSIKRGELAMQFCVCHPAEISTSEKKVFGHFVPGIDRWLGQHQIFELLRLDLAQN